MKLLPYIGFMLFSILGVSNDPDAIGAYVLIFLMLSAHYFYLSKKVSGISAFLGTLFAPGASLLLVWFFKKALENPNGSGVATTKKVCRNCGHTVSWFSSARAYPGVFASSPCEKQGKYCVPIDS